MLKGYMRGLNFGHWISQYADFSDEYFSTYIIESDFKQVADWGFDHIRLPIDYPVFYDEKTGEFIEKGLKYADFAIKTAKKYGLNVVLDLHRTPGYSFNDTYDKEKNSLFFDENQQKLFISIDQAKQQSIKIRSDLNTVSGNGNNFLKDYVIKLKSYSGQNG